ncbi:ClpP/crotonase-like domain-containing protein [Thelonectria olida]|uniref:Enoyl-CoA hydratase domain-containing protein 3, mitochondrial n=1 Tax=Thelonectria olida TaxID=1576542 RepID=A0A9P8VYX2_9HYPO|nr:ClpP/crotonase-like domain-containing protein [Thelonectria olida]
MRLPKLPPSAAYIRLANPQRRNALSLAVLQDLKSQLVTSLTSPSSGQLRLLPPFRPDILDDLESVAALRSKSDQWNEYGWLVDAREWRKERAGLPDVLVLRSEGPVFSSGHDLKELSQLSHDNVKLLFELCAEVMTLIRRSPALVVCPIQGLATAAGFQLAMTTDFPIALATTEFSLPGAKIGLPCTSPSTAVSRRLPPGQAYRLLATTEPVTAATIPGAVDVVPVSDTNSSPEHAAAAFEHRVESVIAKLTQMAPQPQATGKWAFWTQLSIRGSQERGLDTSAAFEGDGYEAAAAWAGRAMALHAKSADAKEGIGAFFEKRAPSWTSKL